MSYFRRPMGDTATEPTAAPTDPTAPVADPSSPAPAPESVTSKALDFLHSDAGKTGGAAALAYHGYRRTGSLVWAAIYALAGHTWPQYAVPVALAQGFGKRKICTTEE